MNKEIEQQKKREQLANKLKSNLRRRKKINGENIKKIALRQAKINKK